MVGMFNNSFYKKPNPFWVEYYKKRKQNKERKNDTRTRQERKP